MSEFIPGTLRHVEWTRALDAQLTALWADRDITTAEIGRRMGISKNSAVGRAHRLHLPPRPSPIRRTTPRAAAPKPVRLSVPKPRINSGPQAPRTSALSKSPEAASAAGTPSADAGVSSLNSAPVPYEPLDGTGVSFGEARQSQCAWPLWCEATPRDERRVCGCKVAQRWNETSAPYCAPHMAIATTGKRWTPTVLLQSYTRRARAA